MINNMQNKITLLETRGMALVWAGEEEVQGLPSVTEVAVNFAWSPSLFDAVNRGKDRRNNEGFVRADYFLIDIDEGMTLSEAEEVAKNFKCSIVLSRNHQKEKLRPNGQNSPPCDRFRIIFEMASPILTADSYRATFFALKKFFPRADEACKDPARGYYKAREIYKVFTEGRAILPGIPQQKQIVTRSPLSSAEGLIKGRLSKATLRFIEEGAKSGERHQALVKATIDLKQNNYTLEEALAILPNGKEEWWSSVDEKKVIGIYEGVEPKYPARIEAVDEAELERWTREWLTLNQVHCTFSGALSIGGTYYTFDDICRKMRIDRDRAGAKIFEEKLKDYLAEWISVAREAHLKKLVEVISPYRGTRAEEELKAFTRTVVQGATPLDEAVMGHFIWQVKRKMTGLPVTHHLMPVFFGPQGSGKTTAIFKLLGPLGELISSPNGFNFVKDYREIHIFKDNFVIFSDELAQADKADVNLLKNLISSPFVESRVMKSHTRERFPNNATLLGATNRPLKDVIMDDTGARRFYELQTPRRMDFSAINGLDYKLIWGAIDAGAESPIKPFLEELAKLQEERFRSKGPVELWMEEAGYEVDDEGPGIETDKALEDFNEYEGGRWTSSSFGRALSRLGVRKFKRQFNGMRTYRYALKQLTDGPKKEGF